MLIVINKEIIIVVILFFITFSNTVWAAAQAGQEVDQYQNTKRQAQQQQEQINTPAVQLQKTSKANGVLVLPKEQRSFLIRDFVIERKGTRRFNWMKGELKNSIRDSI